MAEALLMLIQDMSREKCDGLLKTTHMGRIACAADGQPYVTPFSFAYDGEYFYSFGTVGRKLTWMRNNPRVCVQVDKIVTRQEWMSVVVFGRYEELPIKSDEAARAHDLLAATAVWWEPGYARTTIKGVDRPLDTVWFRVRIEEVTGHQAVSETAPMDCASPKRSWRHVLSQQLRNWADLVEHR